MQSRDHHVLKAEGDPPRTCTASNPHAAFQVGDPPWWFCFLPIAGWKWTTQWAVIGSF